MQCAWQIEEAFCIHKTDLRIRPIWHQREDRGDAHMLVCFLAYVLWKTLEQMCRRSGLDDEQRRVLDELGRIKGVDVVVPIREGTEISRRCVTQPDDHQAILLQGLGLKLPSFAFTATASSRPGSHLCVWRSAGARPVDVTGPDSQRPSLL